MTPNNKPEWREFWILENRCALPIRTFVKQEEAWSEIEPNDNEIHVIDIKAYEASQARVKVLMSVIEKCKEQRNYQMQKVHILTKTWKQELGIQIAEANKKLAEVSKMMEGLK